MAGAMCGTANWSEEAHKVLGADRDWDLVRALMDSYDIQLEPGSAEAADGQPVGGQAARACRWGTAGAWQWATTTWCTTTGGGSSWPPIEHSRSDKPTGPCSPQRDRMSPASRRPPAQAIRRSAGEITRNARNARDNWSPESTMSEPRCPGRPTAPRALDRPQVVTGARHHRDPGRARPPRARRIRPVRSAVFRWRAAGHATGACRSSRRLPRPALFCLRLRRRSGARSRAGGRCRRLPTVRHHPGPDGRSGS